MVVRQLWLKEIYKILSRLKLVHGLARPTAKVRPYIHWKPAVSQPPCQQYISIQFRVYALEFSQTWRTILCPNEWKILRNRPALFVSLGQPHLQQVGTIWAVWRTMINAALLCIFYIVYSLESLHRHDLSWWWFGSKIYLNRQLLNSLI